VVWDPHLKYQKYELEKVQRRAARFVMGQYTRESSVTGMLHQLQWPILEQRREVARLCVMYKALDGSIAITLPPQVQYQQRATRNFHPKCFIRMSTNTDSYMYSFVPRTIVSWNSLPPDLLDQGSLGSFRTAVQQHVLKF
jgi:hypothetical protein